MTYCLNHATLLGFIGERPVVTNTQGGRIGILRVCTFERWSDSTSQQDKERVQWHTVVSRNEKYLPLIEHGLVAGQRILVRGQLEHRSYTDRASGKERWVSEVVVHPFGGSIIDCGGDTVGAVTSIATCSNDVTLLGKLGAEPVVHDFQNGGRICVARVATSERFKGRGADEEKERVHWHTVVCRNEALIPFMSRYLKTGSLVAVQGQIEYRSLGGVEAADRLTTEVVIRPYSGSIIGCDRATSSGGRMPSDRQPSMADGFDVVDDGRSARSRSRRTFVDKDDEAPFVPLAVA